MKNLKSASVVGANMWKKSAKCAFYWAFCNKKEHFIEYLVQVLCFERNRCQNA
jgi:hypothetical protein